MEAFHTRRYGMNIMLIDRAGDGDRPPSSADNNKFHAHVRRYCYPVPEAEIDFCYRPRRRLPIGPVLASYPNPAPGQQLRHCLDRLRAAGHDVIAVDLTTDEIAEKGFVTVKILAPGLHPLWAGDDVPLGGKRVYEAPPRLGHPARGRDQMNLFPHPFP